MRVAAIVSLVGGLAFLQACTLFNPYISQPKQYGTFQVALDDLQKVQRNLDNAVTSQQIIGSVSGLGTFIGFGGAGISAIFHASHASILGFASGGATSFAFNGLYGNRAQTAIYNAGLDAVACINDAISPLVKHDAELKAMLQRVQNDQKSVQSSACECANAAIALERTEGQIREKFSRADIWASMITGAIRSVVASVNKQLAVVVPDAAALARAGSSLGGQILAGVQRPPSTEAEPRAEPNPQPCCQAIHKNIDEAYKVIEKEVSLPVIACKVADASMIAPIIVVLPADASGNAATGITYRTGQTLGYTINGGTPPYMSIQWVGSTPQCFTAAIHSPNVLVLAPVAGVNGNPVNCNAGQTFSFDIYDALGQHLPKTLTITTP
jgi:hypothetical protein